MSLLLLRNILDHTFHQIQYNKQLSRCLPYFPGGGEVRENPLEMYFPGGWGVLKKISSVVGGG